MRAAAAAAACLAAALCGGATAGCSLPGSAEPRSIPSLADSAAACLAQGSPKEAARIFYAMQVRARALAAAAGPGPWAGQAKALQEQIGGPVNRAMGGDLAEWRSAMEWSLRWEQGSPWPDAGASGAPMEEVSKARAEQRAQLRRAADDVGALDKGKFYAARGAAGLPVDEPGWGSSKP